MIPNSWHSYASIFNLGHKAVQELTLHPVTIDEKIDGSQFSFCLTEDGEFLVRSKGVVMHADAPEKMFSKGVEEIKRRVDLLHRGWTYRGEYLVKPKHNALAYDRIPKDHIIIFDINRGQEDYLGPEERASESDRIGFESVPVLSQGMVDSVEFVRQFFDTVSILGGQKIEGVVLKPVGYNLFGIDKKVLMGKFVSESFKETHNQTWKEENPNSGDILTRLGDIYTSQARWMKAIQHLKERGEIQDSPTDIGKIIREIPEDIQKECEEEIKDYLWKWAWPNLRRMVGRGMPEWYKLELLKKQFEKETSCEK